MKSTGVVRRLDSLGRIVLPIELRRVLKLEERDAVEIFTEGEQIILTKYNPGCTFCGSMDNLIDFGGEKVCKACGEKMYKALDKIK